MKLFLIRHGETPWTVLGRYQGVTDVPLNSKGIQQARAIARRLKIEHPTRLYTSTLQRARDTARIAARLLKLKPVADRRLTELHFGQWEGVDYRQLAREGGSEFRRWRRGTLKRPPGGESIDSLARRVGQFLKEILDRHVQETVAIISHGGPIKMFLFKALQWGSGRGAPLPSIWSFRIDPASLSLIEGNPDLLQIVWTNRTDHLSKKGLR